MRKKRLRGRCRTYALYDIYMERFLYSFYRTGKIVDTLEAVINDFPSGGLKKKIEKALRKILTSNEVGNVEEEALFMIEEGIENPLLFAMHRVCVKADDAGKDIRPYLRLLMRLRFCLKGKAKKMFRRKKNISIEEEFQNQFYIWLAFVLYYLQEESVYMAIYRSYDDAPELIRQDVKDMILALKEHPDEIGPYDDFLRDYPSKTIRSVMLYLYSVSNETNADFETALYEILTEEVRRKGRRNI